MRLYCEMECTVLCPEGSEGFSWKILRSKLRSVSSGLTILWGRKLSHLLSMTLSSPCARNLCARSTLSKVCQGSEKCSKHPRFSNSKYVHKARGTARLVLITSLSTCLWYDWTAGAVRTVCTFYCFDKSSLGYET